MKKALKSIPEIPMPAAARVDPALSAFDVLPDSSFVRLPVVRGLFACSPITVWRRVRNGTLPKPVKLSPRVTAWRVGDLRKALAQVNQLAA